MNSVHVGHICYNFILFLALLCEWFSPRHLPLSGFAAIEGSVVLCFGVT